MMKWYNIKDKPPEINKPFCAIVVDKIKTIHYFIGMLSNNNLYVLNTYLYAINTDFNTDRIKQEWYKLNLNEHDILAWCPINEELQYTFIN